MIKTSAIQNAMAFTIALGMGIFTPVVAEKNLPNTTPQNNQIAKNAQQIKWLGISLVPLSPAIKSQLGSVIAKDQGVMIQNVQEKSPAAASGLKAYDILLAFDGNKITSTNQVYDLVQKSKEDKNVKLEIVRNGKKQTVNVKIGLRVIANANSNNGANNPMNNRLQPFAGSPGFNNFWNSPFPQFGQRPNWNQPFTQPDWQNFFGNRNFPDFPQFDFNQLQKNLPNNVQSWSHSESMNVKTLPDGKVRAEMKTKDTNGDEKNFVFEGERDAVIKQIEQQKDLPESQRSQLLAAINGNPMNLGGFFNNQPLLGNDFMRGFPQAPSWGQPWGNFQQNTPKWRGNTY